MSEPEKKPKNKKLYQGLGIVGAILAAGALIVLAIHLMNPLKVYVVVEKEGESPSAEQMEMVTKIMETAGVRRYEVINAEWLDAYLLLRAGEFDMMLGEGMTTLVESPPKTTYSEPFNTHSTYLVTVEGREVADISELEGKKVAAVYGSAAETYAIKNRDQYGYELKTYKDTAATARAIRDRVCVAGIITDAELERSTDFVVCGEPLFSEGDVVAVKAGHEKVLEAANQYIAAVCAQ